MSDTWIREGLATGDLVTVNKLSLDKFVERLRACEEALRSLKVKTSGSPGMVWVEGCLPGEHGKIAALAEHPAGSGEG